MVDLRDLVAFVLSLHKEKGPVLFTVEKIADFSGMNKFVPISPEASLYDALKIFVDKGVHRMPVMEKEDRVSNILSQWDIVSWLNENVSLLGDDGKKTVGQLQKELGGICGIRNLLLFIREDEPVQKAFEFMNTYNVHGVPVLDLDEKIVGNISVSDIKNIMKWDIEAFNATVKEYFEKLCPERIPLVACTLDSTLSEILSQLTGAKVHRIYVVDKLTRPVDIITLTNILETLLKLVSPTHAM